MKRYHINTKGEPGICTARYNCPFGDLTEDHYGSPAEARKAYEFLQEGSWKNPANKQKYPWPTKAITRTFTSNRTPGGQVTVQFSEKKKRMNTSHIMQAWLDVPAKGTVAYVQFLVHDENYHPEVGEHLMLCDVETRVDVRKQGFALELRKSVAEEVGLEIYSSGNMTPEGWEAFGKHLNRLPQEYESSFDKPGPRYNSMGFVASWKDKVPRNGHPEIDYTDEQREAMWQLSDQGVFRKFDDKEIVWAEE